MKKALIVVLILVTAIGSVFASDFKFLFTELDQHTEILAGFLPTLVTIGTSYEGIDLMENNLTQVQVTVGGGYTQRGLYQNPINGAPLHDDILLYDCIQLRWNLKFLQGFGDSWVQGKDLITAYIGYEGRAEKGVDSMVAGQERLRGTGGKSAIPTMSSWFAGALYDSTIYPDLVGDRLAFMNNFYFGAKLNYMEDKMVSNEGLTVELKFQFAPKQLNDKADYYSLTFNTVVGTTLFELTDRRGFNVLSIVAIDRFNANWTEGDKVPVYAQMPVSLGRKVRGFNTNSYNTNFTLVNNLDIRFAGPEPVIDGIFPRLNVFFDMGYYSGDFFNSNVSSDGQGLERFLCSTGFQFEMSFFDFIDLGFQLAYLINGANLRDPNNHFITGATFFLDF